MTPPIAVLTGASRGIGAAVLHRLREAGFDCIVAGLTEPAGAAFLRHDLSDPDDAAMAAAAVRRRLDERGQAAALLVNNAGFGLKRKFLNNTVEQEQAHLDVLVTAPMRLTHAALGPMTRRHSGGIINVSSVAGLQPRGSYSAAKAYLNRFGEWAAHEYARDGVRITTVLPGFTRTEFHERMDVGREAVPKPLWLDAERVVDEALADFDKGKAMSVPSKRYKVIAGVSRHLPTRVMQRFQGLGRK